MKNIVKKLPLVAFIIAIGAAFAFNERVENDGPYGFDETHGWIDVSDLPPGASFDCEFSNDVCLYTEPSKDSDPVEPGDFVYTPPTK